MEVHQLEIFLAVIDTGSVTRAAAAVHLSPGAVSQQIHSLALELHAELFIRSGRRLLPTPDALRLAEHTRDILARLNEVQREFSGDPLDDHRPLHFATGVTPLIYFLGRPLRQLRRRFPKLAIRISVASTEQMVSGLHDRRYDLALISLPYSVEGLEILPLFEEEMLILRPSAKRVTGFHVGTVQPSVLSETPFILYPLRTNVRNIIDGFLQAVGVTPNVIMEAGDTEAIKRLVECGFGCSVLPEFALRNSPRFYQIARVPGHRAWRQQALALPRSTSPRPLTFAVARFLQDSLRAAEPHSRARKIV